MMTKPRNKTIDNLAEHSNNLLQRFVVRKNNCFCCLQIWKMANPLVIIFNSHNLWSWYCTEVVRRKFVGNFWELTCSERVDCNIWSNSSWMSDACNGIKIHFRIACQKNCNVTTSFAGAVYSYLQSVPLNYNNNIYLNNQPCSQHFFFIPLSTVAGDI